MKKKPPALLVALLLLIVMVVAFLMKEPESHPATSIIDPSPSAQSSSPEPARAGLGQPPLPATEEDARRLSPPDWSPPAVFALAGIPAPQVPFPRGENAQRRHPAPVTREIPRDLRTRTPAVLAMTPGDGRRHLLPEEIDLHTRLARRMVLDTAALDHIVAGNTSRALAPTTGDEVLTLEFHAVKTRSPQSHTLLGRVVGEEETSDVIVVYHDGVIHGAVARYAAAIDQHLEYRILADGHMMVRELDPFTMTAVCGNDAEAVGADDIFNGISDEGFEIIPQDAGDAEGDTPGWRTIDIVVGYDQGARAADGGYSQIEARIIASVDRMTLAFANSLVANAELMLLGTIEDPEYVFPGWTSGSMSDELSALNTLNNGRLDAVTNYYQQLGADLVAFILRQADGSAGLANRPGRSSITARDYMTSTRLTFEHELGHNLGCDHSWGDSSQSYHTHYGWRLDPPSTARVRTIMAYDWSWGSGHRIPHFANPSVSFNGAATGAVAGYNVQGDMTADQRYYQGGLGYSGSDPNRFGFNGGNPGLAATDANTINTGGGVSSYGATFASNRSTRTPFSVTSPLANAEWLRGETRNIFFRGGDMQDLASIQLFKGGVLHSTLASNLNPATRRNFSWNIPESLAAGTDYMIRVTLNFGHGGSATADSGMFSIAGTTPRVITHSPAAGTAVSGPVSQVALTFSQPMDPASFSIGSDILSFTGPQGLVLTPAITGASWSSGNTVLTIQFPAQSLAGYYRMVIGPEIADADGKLLDQNQNEIPGEPIDDRYIAGFEISGSGSVETIWSDMIGSNPPAAGWTFSGANSSWEIGTPVNNPSTSFDGAPIIGQNLAGNYNVLENSFAESPTIDCGEHTNVSLSFRGWKGSGRNDTLYIDAWNGSSWQRIYSFSTSAVNGQGDNSWTLYQPSLAGHADLNPDFRLRWGLVDVTTQNSGTHTGWQLDAIVIQGTSAPQPIPAPWVTSHWPATVETPQSSIWIDFSQPMDVLSFSLDDIVSFNGPAGSITATGFGWLGSSTLRIDFPVQYASGQYSLVLAPTVLDELGRPLDQNFDGTPGDPGDQYPATFSIDSGVAGNPLAIGGEIKLANGYFIHSFTQTGNDTFQVTGGGSLEVDVLVVGGGGGGGSSTAFSTAGAGGGGAGGLVYRTGHQVSGTASVTVGAPGAAAGTGNTAGGDGGNSVFGSLVALGGGGGSGGNIQGRAGGSGGGSRGNVNGGAAQQPSSSSGGFGNPGGGWTAAGGDGAGGGGGAGGAAPSSPPHNAKVGGPGGIGRAYDIIGAMVHYAGGGGGGGSGTSAIGQGGTGGGGNGANNDIPPTPGAPNTGGGGGGGNNNRVGADGGSGIVILRYPASLPAETYTISYNGNGNTSGEAPVDAQSPYEVGSTVAVLDAGNLAKTGHTFTGWNTMPDGTGTAYAPGATFTISTNTTLHAQWTPNTYTVTFNPNDGSPADPASIEVTFGSPYGTLATVSRAGYTFNGWFTAAEGGDAVTEATQVSISENHTLYARWTPSGALAVSSGDLDASGNTGGPFSPSSKEHTLENTGGEAIAWTVEKTASWLDLSATSGTLAPGATASVTVLINSAADELDPDQYHDTITFTNTTNGLGNTTRGVSLTVLPLAVDRFAISGIPAQATVGTPITGIMITALDENDGVVTSFTGSVTYGGTAGITGTSANFVAGVLNDVGITPAIAGSDLTFTVDDAEGHTGSAIFDVLSVYEAWAAHNGLTSEDADPMAILQSDGLTNLQKFAFGIDPNVSFCGSIVFDADDGVTTPGLPVIQPIEIPENPAGFQAVFGRRRDYLAAELSYTVEFSADLTNWHAGPDAPNVLTPDTPGEIDAVGVPYPTNILVGDGSGKPQFFRVGVSMN